jgi:NAD(P)-dependent dehydrogenase (short-subunit alcohol dehydrogenase family)
VTVTIINGGTQGLGEAVARKLTERGAKGLLLVGRSADRGRTLAAELTALGTESQFFEADIADPAAPQAIAEACDAAFGTVHGLVNVAAQTSRSNLFTETPEHFDRMMAVNVKAPFFLIQAAARLMVRDGVRGSIVNIGSVAGYGGASKLASYSISKGALAIMTKNLAFSLMGHGIRVNQVNPGWMDTESEHHTQLTWDNAPEDWLVAAEAGRPMGRLVKPWEVANTVVHCLSDDAGVLTGNLIDVEQAIIGAGDPLVPTAADTVWP